MRYTFRRTLIVHWFNGLFAYELQVGPVIIRTWPTCRTVQGLPGQVLATSLVTRVLLIIIRHASVHVNIGFMYASSW